MNIGSKYEQTRDLDIREIAKLVRADVKAAVKAGDLPQGLKVGVRIERYSGGQSLRVEIRAVPEGLRITNPENVLWDGDSREWHRRPYRHTQEARDLLDKVERIRNAYNYDRSDSQTDYFDVRYYGSTVWDWSLEQRDRGAVELEIAEKAAASAAPINHAGGAL